MSPSEYLKRLRTKVTEFPDGGRSSVDQPALLARLAEDTRAFRALDRARHGDRGWFPYLLGAVLMTYGFIDLVYDLNFHPLRVFSMPWMEFYRREIVSFVSHPLSWVGIHPGPLYKSAVALSAIGTSFWAAAEFRSMNYLALYPFPRLQRRIGSVDFREDWLKQPEKPKPESKRRYWFRWVLRFPEAILLSYTLLGFVTLGVGLILGFRTLARWIVGVLAFLLARFLYVFQNLLWPFEDLTNEDAWGSRVFRAVHDPRKSIDDWLTRQLQAPTLLRPGSAFKELIKEVFRDSARVSALAIVVFGFVLLIGWQL